MADAAANPFLDDLFVDHPANLPGVARIHREAFARVVEAVERLLPSNEEGEGSAVPPGPGRLLLLTAPEAGYGKSHLVARLRDHLGAAVPTLLLPFDRSRPATWPVALSSILRQFSAYASPGRPRIAPLDEFSRRFLARLLLDGLAKGAVDPRECPVDPARLRAESATLLAREPDSRLLLWLDKRAADFARAAGPELPRRFGMGDGELAFWTRLFVDLNLREEGALDRLRGLSNGEARERLLQLLRIATDHRPAMLVADALDGFHRSDTAGMEIAEIVNGIRENAPRTVTLVCVNGDLWSSVFAGNLPSAWRDRLDGEALRLHSIDAEAAKELVKHRLRRTLLAETVAADFASRLAEKHRWSDPDSLLSPRKALRQASERWRREAKDFPATATASEGHFFADLPRDEEPARVPATPPPPMRESDLAAIDSIIDDIRGTGKTVVSEAPEARFGEVERQIPPPPPVRQETRETVPIPDSFFSGFTPPLSQGQGVAATVAPPPKAPLTRASLEQTLARHERELLSGPALALDLDRVGRFIRAVGEKHPALGQQEERHPSSRTVCLRWSARGHSVLVGFESPRNVHFWNHLLQQSISSNRYEKIAAFSHPSEPFDPALFASFGFSPAVIRGRVDIIEMNDRELAMIYAADLTMRDYGSSPDAEKAAQLVTLHLDPLWRRLVQPL